MHALKRLHVLNFGHDIAIPDVCDSPDEFREAVLSLVEVLSVSLREVGALALSSGPYRPTDQGTSPSDSSVGAVASTRGPPATASSSALGLGPSDWVPLLVWSADLIAQCLSVGINSNGAKGGSNSQGQSHGVAAARCAAKPPAAHVRACTVAAVAALLHCDALPALGRLLSAEAQRGPARALMSPRQLATCLLPLNRLIMAIVKAPTALLPPHPGLLLKSETARVQPGATAAAPSRAPPNSARSPASAAPSGSIPAAASSRRSATRNSAFQGRGPASRAGSPAQPTPQPQPQRLGPAVLSAVAESGVLEAACRTAVVMAQQGAGGQERGCVHGEDPICLLKELFRVLVRVAEVADKYQGSKNETLRAILTGPCAQVRGHHSRCKGLHRMQMQRQQGRHCEAASTSFYVCFLAAQQRSVLSLASTRTYEHRVPIFA